VNPRPRPHILIVDDEASVREALKLVLEDSFAIDLAGSGEEALKLLEKMDYAAVLCDIGLPGMNGEALLGAIKASWPGSEVVMVTAVRDVDQAVRCMKNGAYDYIAKPWNVEELQAVVKRAVEKWALSSENNLLKQGQQAGAEPQILGSSEAMKELRERILKVAAHDSTVLITGESGTGKELVARAIHFHSPRRKERFVPIASGSIPANLVESELFGHEKGAFSSAFNTRIGKFEYASGGTIFLDDVTTLPMESQAKLLRVLQERELCRLGSNRVIPIDVRVISSANVDLREMVARGQFREDLYWRLCGVPIAVPPLRDRDNDVEELFRHFVDLLCAEYRRKKLAISPNVAKALRSHSFPGNVRELKHLAETVVVLCEEDEIGVSALPIQLILQAKGNSMDTVPLKQAVHEFERQVIIRTLRSVNGNQSRGAEMLGIHRNTLILKMIEFNIPNKKAPDRPY
jgi:two-component system response regulator AtoC